MIAKKNEERNDRDTKYYIENICHQLSQFINVIKFQMNLKYRNSHRWCSLNKNFWKTSQYSQENIYVGVSYSFVLSLAVICCHSLSCFFTRCHSLSLLIHFHLLYHTMSLVIIRCTTRGQFLSIIVTRYTTSLFFINYHPAEISHEIGKF